MILLSPAQSQTLRDWFLPEQPGPLIGMHVIRTGNGALFVDRWPDPRAVLADTAGNYSLSGDADALTSDDLRRRIRGFVAASSDFVPILKKAFPSVGVWERIILERRSASGVKATSSFQLRRLRSDDAYCVWGLSPESAWISKTWGGPKGLAASGRAWGAFVDGLLGSVACTFFYGEKYEEIGVVTEPKFRGLGLSTACAAALCEDIQARGHQASWTTSPDNISSLRVAEKLGFTVQRNDRLYVVGKSIPEPAEKT